jgi:hypothetical protein
MTTLSPGNDNDGGGGTEMLFVVVDVVCRMPEYSRGH